ncbi:MAG: PAS domain S-box protein [Desulfobacterales bacterium]|nr:PAS domain S-box protein [Desulfobacterales bacterium]
MKGKSTNPTRITNKLVWIGIGLGALFWILESAIHAFIFHQGGLITQMFTPGLHEIWMRSLGACLIIIIFGVYAQFISRKRAEKALRESEENLTTTLNSIGDAVIATDTEGRVLRMNPVAEKLTGWKLWEAKGHPLDEVFHIVNEHTREAVESPVEKVLREGIIVGLANHTLLISKEGKECSIDDSGAPIRNAQGEITGVVLVFRDITKKRQADTQIKHLNAVLRAIRKVNQLISKEKDRNRLLKGVCDSLIETRGYYNAWISLIDESGGLVTAAEAGLGKDFLPMLERLKRGELTDCAQKALRKTEVVVTGDPFSTCTDCPLAKKYSGRGAMTMRLEYGGKAQGLLSVSIPRNLVADKAELALFEEVAGDIAFALHSIELENERKSSEEALRESEVRLRTIFEAADNVSFIMTDLAGKEAHILEFSPGAERMFGYDREEVIGKPVAMLHLPEDVARFPEVIEAMRQRKAGFTGESTLVRKSGERFPALFTTYPIFDAEGNMTTALGVSIDITKRKQAEEALQESEEKYRMLFNSSSDAMFVYHPTPEGMPGKFIEVNNVACQKYGYTREELLKLSPLDISAPEDVPNIPARQKKLFAEKHVIFEKVQVSKEGRRIPVEISSHLFNFNGQPTVLSTVRDITERKRAEEHIRSLSQQLIKTQESERQRLSRDLHDYVAQDLSTLKIGLDTLFDNHSEAPPETRLRVPELSKMIQGTIMAVRDLAYDLRPAGLNQLGLARTVQQHCEEFSAKSGVKVDFFAGGIDDSKVGFDTKITLYRLIQEGLNNVKKHADTDQVTIRLVASFPNIILRIEDNGKGFDVENRLVSAANERRMGLRTMEERVALLQGKMRLESHPKGGTKIFIEVPCKGKDNGK